MRAKIAHISDVHFERLDRDVSDRLAGALRLVSPNLLIFTGDLVDNFWKIKQAKEWLLQLCTGCQLDPERQLVVIPGNHDYRLYGNFGFRPATGHCFRKHFAEWNRNRVILYREYGICIIRVDSNPIIFGFARGVVSQWQLRRIRAELEALRDEDRRFVAAATKIALVHHHPLPVPHEGQDTFLMLEKAQNLIQFLAEQRVDCILHGHKHRAPHSLLSLGTCISSDRVVQVIGAGTAVAGGTDRESRGHNFNVITVEDTGLLFAQQYFAQPGEDFR
ncbi:MAG: metallophosphoesterase, partial [Terriglobales bacterium]